MSTLWQRVARAGAGDDYATVYAGRFRELAESGEDVDGEARFVADLLPPPARVLDAGCGTGRIAIRLTALGYITVGCDVDEAMVAVARQDAPDLGWHVADLATLDLGATFDVVLLAGNVVPLLEPGTLGATGERLAAHLAPGGVLVAGFGLDDAHLPTGTPVTDLDDVDIAWAAAGLVAHERWSTWDRQDYLEGEDGGGYVVGIWGRGPA